MLATNVVASLAARILQAQFGQELAFAGKPGAATLEAPDSVTANADYDMSTGAMRISPTAHNNGQTMYMRKDATGTGYTGDFYGNPTTADVLNMVETMRHELTHARSNIGSKVLPSYPAFNSERYLPKGVSPWELVDTLRMRGLPSMDATHPTAEFLATAIPLSTAEAKLGPLTKDQRAYKREIDHVLQWYPGVSRLITDMERPELYKLGSN